MITVRNLSKSFGKERVLHSINLQLEKKVYGLLGANGAGKTTLIRCLAGLFEPHKGEILYHDEPIHQSKRFHEDIGYLPQSFGMFRELTLHEMMEYIGSLKGLPTDKCSDAITEALTYVNLEDRRNTKIKALSGGMVRRAGIAQSILGDSRILLLDEPTAGLDPAERASFKNTVNKLRKDRIIVLSTHIVEDVEASCDHVIVIEDGRVVFEGSPEDLKAIAKGKVYQVRDSDLTKVAGKKFVLTSSQIESETVHRVLTTESLDYPSEKPSLEDGYMCLVKRI